MSSSAKPEKEQTSSDPEESPAVARVPHLRAWHYAALAMPFAGLLYPPLYARWTPEVFGIPFFYAYQFAWIFLSAGLTALVYRTISK